MYCFDSRIRYSEVDAKGQATFHSILDYFQDCSSFQSEDLKVGVDFLMKKQVAWVLVYWQIEVKRYPSLGDQVRVSTWPYDFKGFYGYRNFQMTDEAGNCLAQAASLWVLLNLKTGRPTRILPEMVEAYVMEKPLPIDLGSRKMKLPEQMEEKESFEVQKFHLDTNQHVNNGKYILMAQEYLPETFRIGKMRAEYKKSAVYGDRIFPAVSVLDGKTVVSLADEQKKPYVMIELEEKHD